MNVPTKREGFVEESRAPHPRPQSQPQPTTFVGNGGGPASHQQPVIEEPPIELQAPSAPVETWPIHVKLLHKPIKNNFGEMVHELVFREPTGGDINRYGNPCRISVDGEVIIDEQKMMRVMAALSGVLIPLLEPMDPRDWNSCAYRLRSFFLPEVAAW